MTNTNTMVVLVLIFGGFSILFSVVAVPVYTANNV